MSATIKKSIDKLASAVVKLEKAIETKKKTASAAPLPHPVPQKKNAPQTDLFGAITAGQNASNFNPVNVRMLATRLDHAINQVESILKEGRG